MSSSIEAETSIRQNITACAIGSGWGSIRLSQVYGVKERHRCALAPCPVERFTQLFDAGLARAPVSRNDLARFKPRELALQFLDSGGSGPVERGAPHQRPAQRPHHIQAGRGPGCRVAGAPHACRLHGFELFGQHVGQRQILEEQIEKLVTR